MPSLGCKGTCFSLLLLECTAGVFVPSAGAQAASNGGESGIILGPSVQISADRPNAPHVESFLAISPKDPHQMLASSISFENGVAICVVYSSHDGGRTWRRSDSFCKGVVPFSGGDPVVYYDNTGAGLFASIDSGSDLFVRVWRSTDGGVHWDNVTKVPGLTYDREFLGIDRTSGPYAGRVYLAGEVLVRQIQQSGNSLAPELGITHSADNALTFSPAKVFDTPMSDNRAGGVGNIGELLVASRGELLVPFMASLDMKGVPPRAFWFFVSKDGGRTFSARQGLPYMQGTMSIHRRVTGPDIHTAIDQSTSPFADRIYVAYDDYKDDRYDLYVAHSDDLGESWSSPVKVNDNIGQGDPGNRAIAVNRNGVVAIIWNDRRDDPTDMCYRLYGSASLDGGETFLPNVQFSSHPTCFNTRGNWEGSANAFAIDDGVELTSVPDRFANGGETQGLAATPDGQFHVTWNNDVNGVMQLWYTTFTIEGNVHRTKEQQAHRDECTFPPPAPDNRVRQPSDMTKDVSFEASAARVDFAPKSVSITVAVKNRSMCSVAAPLTLVLDKIETDFEGLRVSNADNGLTNDGAAWKLLENRQELAPGEQSEPHVIRWQFDGQVPEPKHLLSQFVVHFKVLSEPIKPRE